MVLFLNLRQEDQGKGQATVIANQHEDDPPLSPFEVRILFYGSSALIVMALAAAALFF